MVLYYSDCSNFVLYTNLYRIKYFAVKLSIQNVIFVVSNLSADIFSDFFQIIIQ
jgi:hypothetical protein